VLPSAPSTCTLFPLAIEEVKFVPVTVMVCVLLAVDAKVVGDTPSDAIVGATRAIESALVEVTAEAVSPPMTLTLKGLCATS
jgi:hypothetical protein